MNRKLVNGLLLVALASGGCGVFTSCKDTDDDYYSGVIKGQVSLEKQLEDLKAELAEYAKKSDVAAAKQEVLDQLNREINNLANIYATKDEVNGLKTALMAEINTLTEALGDVKTRLTDVETGLSDLQTEYAETAGKVAAMWTLLYEDNDDFEGGLVAQVKKMLDDVANNQADIDNIYELINAHKEEFEVLQGQLAYYINSINDRLDNTITDITLNQTWNPMFGTINLPVGLSSTIAANYYGKADKPVNFPLGTASVDVLQGYEPLISAGVIGALTDDTKGRMLLPAGEIFMNETEVEVDGVKEMYGKLGQLYLTINPNTANISGTTFKLVTSSGNTEVPILVKVSETDEELKFGVDLTRTAANGFYRADLYIKPADATKITIDIEKGLKSAMKDAILNHTKSDFVQLGKLLMAQMKDFLPAYAVKATWKAPNTNFLPTEWDAQEEVEYSFYGKYEIAATAIRPLGYAFMEGQGAHKDLLPTVGSLKEAINRVIDEMAGKITINTGIGEITKPSFDLQISDIKFNDPMEIRISLAGLTAGDQKVEFEGGSQEIVLKYDPNKKKLDPVTNDNALNGLIDKITEAINKTLTGTDAGSLNSQIQTNLIGKVNEMVDNINEMLGKVQSNIEGSVQSSINAIKDALDGKLGRLDNLVDKYNALANRINNMLKDPNHYLQVMMAYQAANGDLGALSTDFNDPTIFRKAGGNAIELLATSYTAELIAPAYKKYVAVSRAWKADGTPVDYTDQVGGAKAANQTPYLNEVRPGNQQKFAINADNLQAGYKYEIVYSALDYRGYTSTRLFYITVAE